MTQNIIIPLSDRAYQRLKRWSEARQQDIGDAIADFLLENLPNNDALIIPPAEEDPRVEREKAAYVRLHSQLIEQYAGQYVAIYGEKLIDHDPDYGALFERIDDRYPDDFVWLARVEEEPIGTIALRSPRFVEGPA